MKKVAILTLEGSVSVVVTGAVDTLHVAGNRYMECVDTESSIQSFFDVDLVSLNEKSTTFNGNIRIACDTTLDKAKDYDIVIVPQITPDFDTIFNKYKRYFPWIKNQYNSGADIFSVCTGSFILAEAGILDNKPATTHWNFIEEFSRRYPSVKLKPEEVITSFDRVHCSAGSSSFLNLMLYMIEIFCGRDIAVFTSKMLLIDMAKSPQSSYQIFSKHKSHNDRKILEIQQYIEDNVDRDLAVTELYDKFYLSRSSLHRKFKEATGLTPLEYIHRLKIEFAKRKLENEKSNVSAISELVGYRDINHFRDLFKRYTGLTPMQYRQKYSLNVYKTRS